MKRSAMKGSKKRWRRPKRWIRLKFKTLKFKRHKTRNSVIVFCRMRSPIQTPNKNQKRLQKQKEKQKLRQKLVKECFR